MYDEEKSNSSRLQDQINSLNSKNRTLKRNLDDTVSKDDVDGKGLLCILQESDAEGLRARIRKLQAELSDAEENIATLNATITKMRSSARKAPPSKVIRIITARDTGC